MSDPYFDYRNNWQDVVDTDIATLEVKDREYNGSWKKRGGINAWFMLCRKWDRLEEQVQREVRNLHGETTVKPFDIFQHAVVDGREEGLLDDIRDLRRYLINVEAEILALAAKAKRAQG